MLETQIGSLKLSSPLLTGSGTFGHDPAALSFLNEGDLGALVLKTVTPEPWAGNPTPRMAEFNGGVLNAIGLENKGLEYWKSEVGSQLDNAGIPVVANAGGHSVKDYVSVVETFHAMDAVVAIELNLSCPNVTGGIQFSTCADSLSEVVTACRHVTDKSLWVKLSPNVTDIRPLAIAAEESGVDAITVCNTVIGMLVDWRSARPKLANRTGGMSGPAVKPIAMRLVDQCAQVVGIPIVASGGIMNAEDVLEFVVAGATAVQVGTASFANPLAISEIAGELRTLLASNSLSLSSLRGTLQKNG